MPLLHGRVGHAEEMAEPVGKVAVSPIQSSTFTSSVPTHLGRYEIIGVLGRGGMATVYLANSGGEGGFSRLVAIKVLHPHLAEQQDFVAMLLDEARLAARIHHPNVVPVVDLQSDGAQRYIVMDYVEGCSLSDLLKRQKSALPLGILIEIVRDALNGLHAAHTLTDASGVPINLIHRDVTPQNILVGVDGMARLTDFGVALAQARIHHTRQRELKGKIAFMAPEQARCQPLDRRADIFSVGCLLWIALTGQSLFLSDNDAATLSNVLNKHIVSPSTLNPNVPEVISSICMRALERDPDERWSNAAVMAEALRHAAVACHLVTSRREISDWIKRMCRRELEERRIAVRDATLAQKEKPKEPELPSFMLPQAQPSVLLEAKEIPVLTGNAEASAGKSRYSIRSPWVLALVAVILVVALGAALGGFVIKRRTRDLPPQAQTAPATVPELLPKPAPVLPPVVVPVPAAAPVGAAVADRPQSPRTEAKPAPDPVAKVRKRARVMAAAAIHSVKDKALAPAEAPVVERHAAPRSPPPPKTPAVWDKDSPLPPQ
jgi:eukaryotic-like serine/threonine-protein kinase